MKYWNIGILEEWVLNKPKIPIPKKVTKPGWGYDARIEVGLRLR